MGLGATSSWLLKMNYNVRYITRKIFPNKCTRSYKKSFCIRYNKQPKITLSEWKLRRILKRGTWLFRQRKGKSKQYSQQGHERGLQVCKGISQGLKKKNWLLCQLRNCPSVECCKSDSCKLIYCHDANLMYCLDELMGGTIAQYVRFLDDFAQHFLAIPYNVKSPDFAHPDGKLFNKFPFGTQRSSRKLC